MQKIQNRPVCFFFLPVLVFFMVFLHSMCLQAETIPAFKAFITRSDSGHIDWDNGLIYGIGRGYIKDNRNSRARAIGAANMAASGNIIKLAANINLNDTDTLQSFGKGRIVIKLKAFLQDRLYTKNYVRKGADSYWEVTRVAHINGIKGLTASVLNLINPFPSQSFKKRSAPLTDTDKPWLLVDARTIGHTSVEPALFPRIVTREGRQVHSLRQADKNAVIQRGMARYVIEKKSFSGGWTSHKILDMLFKNSGILASIDKAFAAEKKRKRSRRRSFIVASARGLQGLKKTNIVISEADAQKLKAEDNASAILKNCRVLVLSSSPVGGIEGRRLKSLLAFVF